MAGTNLMPTKNGLPEPKTWAGDYWANVPKINGWFKENEQYLKEYDGGKLEKALKAMGEKKETEKIVSKPKPVNVNAVKNVKPVKKK